ncbi:MAG: DNA-binding response regulator [Clostridia bacterium]|nr:DNA-binding response regulator [Clostridia bacterium]
MNILLVEDDKAIALGLEYSLMAEGYKVTVCTDLLTARQNILMSFQHNEKNYDLFLIDITLPDGNGYELCKIIKQKGDIPVIFLTALDEEVNVVMGLDMGADDYITKPFRIRELMSRIKSVLRRYKKTDNEKIIYEFEDIRINTAIAKVYKDNKEVFLTALEYRLLLTFANNEGQILSRNQLLEGIWDIAGDFVNDNTLTVYIKRIREKLENNPQNPKLIKTIRGLGYIMGDTNA